LQSHFDAPRIEATNVFEAATVSAGRHRGTTIAIIARGRRWLLRGDVVETADGQVDVLPLVLAGDVQALDIPAGLKTFFIIFIL
jgi:hypothetical protein